MRTNPKEAFKSQEMAETVRSAILTGTVVLIGGAVLDSNKKESDKTFVEKIAGKVYRDSLSLIGALDPTFWFGTPRTADFLLDISSAMKSLAMLETYKQDGADYLEGELKGANKLKKSLTPSLVKQVIGNDSLTSRESEKMKALPNEEKGLYKEAIEEKNKIEKEKANGKEDMQSVYQEIKKLKQKGRMDEARALYDSLDKNQLESIKTVITAEKAKVTKQKTEKMYGTVIKIKKLKKEGKMEEARAVFDSVPEEEREYLLKAAKQLSK
jgi:hypothetical protein